MDVAGVRGLTPASGAELKLPILGFFFAFCSLVRFATLPHGGGDVARCFLDAV